MHKIGPRQTPYEICINRANEPSNFNLITKTYRLATSPFPFRKCKSILIVPKSNSKSSSFFPPKQWSAKMYENILRGLGINELGGRFFFCFGTTRARFSLVATEGRNALWHHLHASQKDVDRLAVRCFGWQSHADFSSSLSGLFISRKSLGFSQCCALVSVSSLPFDRSHHKHIALLARAKSSQKNKKRRAKIIEILKIEKRSFSIEREGKRKVGGKRRIFIEGLAVEESAEFWWAW